MYPFNHSVDGGSKLYCAYNLVDVSSKMVINIKTKIIKHIYIYTYPYSTIPLDDPRLGVKTIQDPRAFTANQWDSCASWP